MAETAGFTVVSGLQVMGGVSGSQSSVSLGEDIMILATNAEGATETMTLAQYIRRVIREAIRMSDDERREGIAPCSEYPMGIGVPLTQILRDDIADALAARP